MNKGWTITIGVVLLVLCGVAVVWYIVTYAYNPYFKGKRLYAWKDQAIHDPDPVARTEATETLIQAFKELRGETRVQLVLHFCYDHGAPELPSEVVPFLIEALHAREIQYPDSYQAIALSQVQDAAAIPALVEVLLHDEDDHAHAGAVAALNLMGPRAAPAEAELRGALGHKSEQVRARAQNALREIAAARARKK